MKGERERQRKSERERDREITCQVKGGREGGRETTGYEASRAAQRQVPGAYDLEHST